MLGRRHGVLLVATCGSADKEVQVGDVAAAVETGEAARLSRSVRAISASYVGVRGAWSFVPGHTIPPRSPMVTLPQRAA